MTTLNENLIATLEELETIETEHLCDSCREFDHELYEGLCEDCLEDSYRRTEDGFVHRDY